MYEKLYNQEVDRGEKITARLSMPLTLVVALSGFLSYLFQHAVSVNIVDVTFWVLWGLSCCALILGLIFFCIVWFGKKNDLMPTAKVIDEHYSKTLKNHYYKYPNSQKNTEAQFNKFVHDSYRDYSTTNANNNDFKSKCLTGLTISLGISILFMCISLIPYQIAISLHPKKETLGCQIINHHRHHQILVHVMSETAIQDKDQPTYHRPHHKKSKRCWH